MILAPNSVFTPPLFERMLLSPKATQRYSEYDLRRSICANLGIIFNQHCLPQPGELAEYPHTRESVVFMGIADPLRMGGNRKRFAGEMAEAIRTFEPRIAPESVLVTPTEAAVRFRNPAKWYFNIHGDMRGVTGITRTVCLFAVFDLESGHAAVCD